MSVTQSPRYRTLLFISQSLLILAVCYLGYDGYQKEVKHEKEVKALKRTMLTSASSMSKAKRKYFNDICTKQFRAHFRACYKHKWDIRLPCSKQDKLRQIYTVPHLGRFCLEKKTKDLIKLTLKAKKQWEPEQIPYFKKYVKPGTVVLDIGTHIGTHTVTFSKLVGKKGQVHSFEPQHKIYQELLTNLELNNLQNVTAHFVAVGDKHARVTMDLPNIHNEGATKVGGLGNRVELRTVDSFHFKNVSFVKIDVEGFELGVLKGAKETFQKYKPVLLVEIWVESKAAEEKKKQTLALLKQYGYTKISVIPKSKHNYLVRP